MSTGIVALTFLPPWRSGTDIGPSSIRRKTRARFWYRYTAKSASCRETGLVKFGSSEAHLESVLIPSIYQACGPAAGTVMPLRCPFLRQGCFPLFTPGQAGRCCCGGMVVALDVSPGPRQLDDRDLSSEWQTYKVCCRSAIGASTIARGIDTRAKVIVCLSILVKRRQLMVRLVCTHRSISPERCPQPHFARVQTSVQTCKRICVLGGDAPGLSSVALRL